MYYGLDNTTGYVEVPQYQCSKCRAPVSVHPYQVGCVPTAPRRNSQLVSMELADHFLFLHLKGGVAARGMFMCCH